MLKVGIMSMQRILNYGSFLQVYALKKIIESLDCEVEFVDYHIERCLIESKEGTGIRRKIGKALKTFKCRAPLSEKLRFIKYKKNYADKYFQYLGIDNKYNYTPKLDVLLIGSDEVFNCVQDNSNVGFSPELFGKGNKAKKLISYAASFGNTTVEKIEKHGIYNELSDYLKSFDAISVRDNNSWKIIKNLTGKEPEYNIDPVLVYDYMNLCDKIPRTVPYKDYMVLYGYSERFTGEECEEIRKYASERKLRILCIGGIQSCCDRFIDCPPFEVMAYFKNAACVVTDTFHGTILSVITHSNFAVFVRKSGYGNFEKLNDLLEKLQQKERIVFAPQKLEKVLSTKIKYEKTDSVIQAEREKAKAYLRKELI